MSIPFSLYIGNGVYLMVLTEQQRIELLEAAKPLIKWLNENCHPHCGACVIPSGVELFESVANCVTLEFVKD